MSWFAFDIDAYDADTMHLSACEDGVYSRLLRFYYKTRMSLPDDDRALAAIARVTMPEWDAMRDTIRAFFRKRRGRLINTRAEKTLDREDALAKKRTDKARGAAEKRHAASKGLLLLAPPEQNSDMLGDATRPDHTREEKKETRASPRSLAPQGWPEFWEAYPHKVGKGAALPAYARALRKASAEQLLAGVVRYRNSKPPDHPWCNPQTWLNQERWNDQPDLINGAPHGNAASVDFRPVPVPEPPRSPAPKPPPGWRERLGGR